jgi:mRNA-degrading endonuclease RelE of RelBE toxin-antitoxin system
MVRLIFGDKFEKAIQKIRDPSLKIKIRKQLLKIKENPTVGKPMRNIRKRTRELYIKPFRLSYKYFDKEDKVIILDIYHKDEQ